MVREIFTEAFLVSSVSFGVLLRVVQSGPFVISYKSWPGNSQWCFSMSGYKMSAGDDKSPNHTVLSRLGTDLTKE